MPEPPPLIVRSIEPVALEVPLEREVRTPITPVRSLVNLLVVVRDDDGVEGWGEIWCNFPRFGLRHRARLLAEVFAPALLDRPFASPTQAWTYLEAFGKPLCLQSGEPGPIGAVIAGIDIALWDVAAKKAGVPLWRLLGGRSGRVPVYASLGRMDDLPSTIDRCMDEGHRAVKVRSSGTIDDHVSAVRPVRSRIGPSRELMLDVNGSWAPEAAIATIGQLAPYRLAWLEEPIAADASRSTWARLADAAPMPIAGGENLIGAAMLETALDGRALAVLQPDITKWGGFSGLLPIARRIVAAGRRLCPHAFSGTPGVLAAAHLLAASGSRDGLLEYPVGRHPLREALPGRSPRDGTLDLGDAPGLGLDVDRARLESHRLAL